MRHATFHFSMLTMCDYQMLLAHLPPPWHHLWSLLPYISPFACRTSLTAIKCHFFLLIKRNFTFFLFIQSKKCLRKKSKEISDDHHNVKVSNLGVLNFDFSLRESCLWNLKIVWCEASNHTKTPHRGVLQLIHYD